jgi:hypothetical protein
VRCLIELEYSSPEEAQRVQRSIELDNDEHLDSIVRGSIIEAKADASSLGSLLHTLDDFLSCVSVAEGVVRGRLVR